MFTPLFCERVAAGLAGWGAAALQFAGGLAGISIVCIVGIVFLIMLPIIAVSFILGACFGKPVGAFMMKLFEKICSFITSLKSSVQTCSGTPAEPVSAPTTPTPVSAEDTNKPDSAPVAPVAVPVAVPVPAAAPAESPSEESTEESPEAMLTNADTEPEQDDTVAQPEVVLPQEVEQLARELADPGLSSYVADQLGQLQVVEAGGAEGWIIKVVDLVDSMQELTAYGEEDLALLSQIRNSLIDCLKEHSVELLSYEDWTPAYQRAVKVNRVLPEGSFPMIVRTFATGVMRSGRLMRKQEVELNLAKGDSAV